MSRNLYSIHPGVAHAQSVVANLQARTGRTLAEWVAQVEKQGLMDEKAIRSWLKEKGLGATQA